MTKRYVAHRLMSGCGFPARQQRYDLEGGDRQAAAGLTVVAMHETVAGGAERK